MLRACFDGLFSGRLDPYGTPRSPLEPRRHDAIFYLMVLMMTMIFFVVVSTISAFLSTTYVSVHFHNVGEAVSAHSEAKRQAWDQHQPRRELRPRHPLPLPKRHQRALRCSLHVLESRADPRP